MGKRSIQKAWVVAVDMGYGHQRAAYPLHLIAERGQVIRADSYSGIPKRDREIWRQQLEFYHAVSRFKKKPVIGDIAFSVFDQFQEIKPFYPKRDLSRPNLQTRSTYLMIQRKGWGRHLINRLSKNPLPFVTTFFVLAYMAEEFEYPGEIYLIIADADVSRAWAPLRPRRSKIKFLVPTRRVYERLRLYGVKSEHIYLTGFPLPHENVGGENLRILKKDLGRRIVNLDPNMKYIPKYQRTLERHLGPRALVKKQRGPLTIMFAVGGAGAQRETGIAIVKSLQQHLKNHSVRLILVAGVYDDVRVYFKQEIGRLNLGVCLDRSIRILYSSDKAEYFAQFNLLLRRTDLLWTKPSELSFYCALGLPIIMTEPIGSQEKFNRRWLRAIGAGIVQENVKYTDEWLFDWLESGWLAEAAMQGFFEGAKYGTYNIMKIVGHEIEEPEQFETVLQY